MTSSTPLRPAPALAAVVALAALTACGGASSGGAAGPPGGSVTTVAPTTVTIAVDQGQGATSTWTLTCDPAGGDHPDPAAACAALARSGAAALPPVPADRACTMVYGGPQTATVAGRWRGERVDASFSRTNGCEIARWRALVPLLPDVRGAGAV